MAQDLQEISIVAAEIADDTITNVKINSAAAMSFSKMAALSNSIVPVTNSSGVITSSAVTATQLGYLDATSSIQTQFNAKLTSTLASASVFIGNVSNVATATAITGDLGITNAGVSTVSKTRRDIPYVTGRYYRSTILNNNIGTAAAISANTLYGMPFFVHTTNTFDRLGIRVTTAINTGNIRFGIYNDSAGVPGSLVTDAGVFTMSGVGAQDAEVTINQQLTPGIYWLVFVSDNTPLVSTASTTAMDPALGEADLTATLPYQRITQVFSYGALVTPFGTATLSTGAGMGTKLRSA